MLFLCGAVCVGVAMGAVTGFIAALAAIQGAPKRVDSAAANDARIASSRPLPRPLAHGARGWIEGVARGEPSKRSPIYDVPCLAYHVEIEEYQPNPAFDAALRARRRERNDGALPSYSHHNGMRDYRAAAAAAGPHHWWIPVFVESHSEPFLLETPTANVRVELDLQSELDLTTERELQHGFWARLPRQVNDRLEGLGIARRSWAWGRPLRIRERRLEAGERCTVVGQLTATTLADAYRGGTVVWSLAGNGDWLIVRDRTFEQSTQLPQRPAQHILWAMPLACAAGVGAFFGLLALLITA
jgi:hypothetical protein